MLMDAKTHTDAFFKNSKYIIDAIALQHEELARVYSILMDAWRKNTSVFIIGNGGSAGTATQPAGATAATLQEVLLLAKAGFVSLLATECAPVSSTVTSVES